MSIIREGLLSSKNPSQLLWDGPWKITSLKQAAGATEDTGDNDGAGLNVQRRTENRGECRRRDDNTGEHMKTDENMERQTRTDVYTHGWMSFASYI